MNIKTLSRQFTQVAELYAKKFGIRRDDSWYMLKLQEELGELTQIYLMASKQARTKGKSESEIRDQLALEVADVFGMTILLAQHFKIDLEKAIRDKWLSRLPTKNTL